MKYNEIVTDYCAFFATFDEADAYVTYSLENIENEGHHVTDYSVREDSAWDDDLGVELKGYVVNIGKTTR